MFHRLGKYLCVLAAFAVMDTHLIFVQGWAWGTMLQERAPERGVVEALDSTFSGSEPCPMCSAVQEEQHEKQKEAPVPESSPTVKWIPGYGAGNVVMRSPYVCYAKMPLDLSLCIAARDYEPDVPPPRFC